MNNVRSSKEIFFVDKMQPSPVLEEFVKNFPDNHPAIFFFLLAAPLTMSRCLSTLIVQVLAF